MAREVARAMRAAGRDTEAARQLFPCGFTIAGYDIEQIVGSGGQAHVFKAVQRSTGCAVAIKILIDGRFADSHARRRFEREATLLASLKHPHVVALIDQGRTSHGAHYLTMPFIEGCTLDKFFESSEYDQEKGLRILATVARAMHACHEAGIIHRDLKPQNILVDKYEHAHVLDFGMARTLESNWAKITRPGCDVGSVLWSSPEQIAGESALVGPATDIYSIGVMLYQSLAGGRHPYFVEGSLGKTLDRIAECRPVPPSDHAWLNEIVSKAIRKRPDDRYLTAADLAEAMESKPPKMLRLWRQRFRLAFVGAIVVCLTTVAAFSWSAVEAKSPSAESLITTVPLPTFTNTVGMTLVRIPKGDFDLNDSGSAKAHLDRPSTRHRIIERPFWISTTETTWGQWNAIMHESKTANAADLPVENVLSSQIDTFVRRLSDIEGKQYRLPSEVEWEYAARDGGHVKEYDSKNFLKYAWSAENSQSGVHPVGQLAPNAWGLHDMFGNVSELCVADSVDGVSSQRDLRARGGSYTDPSIDCVGRANRQWSSTSCGPGIGFRIVLENRTDK